MKRIWIVLLLSLALAAGAFAQATDYMNVYAYNAGYALLHANDLDFGLFYTAGEPTYYASTTVNVALPEGTPYNVTADAGLNFGSGWRGVANGGSSIRYGLYREGGGEWGDHDYADTYQYGNSFTGTGTGTPTAHVVNGQLYVSWGPSSIPTGYYQDTVTVTLYY